MIPWFSIITWLISYLLTSRATGSSTKAAMVATGAALGAYYLADPANTSNVLGVTLGGNSAEKTVAGDPAIEGASSPTQPAYVSLGTTALNEVGSTLRGWGPTGTLGVIAGTSALTSGALGSATPWLILGAILLLFTR